MRYITINGNNKVVSIRQGKKIVEGEIQSKYGLIGQIMLEDGKFMYDEEEIELTNKLKRISELRQLISDKKLLDEPCTVEQAELKTLLGI